MDQPNSTVAASNFTSSPGLLPHPSWNSRGLAPAVMLSLCFILGVPGNIAVLLFRPNWQHLSSLSQSLLLNLTISDLLCLLTIPLWIYTFTYGWTIGWVACKLVGFVVYCSVYGSLLTVTGLSIQRYLVVVRHQSCQQVRKRWSLFLLWLVAFIMSIRHLVVQQLVPDQQRTDCRAQYSSNAWWTAALVTEIVSGIVFFGIVGFSYIHLKRKLNQAAFFNNPQTSQLITSIIICFTLLWVPYLTINVLSIAALCLNNENLLKFCKDKRKIAVALTFVNSCLNPVLYAFNSQKCCTVCQKREPLQQNQSIPQISNNTLTAEL